MRNKTRNNKVLVAEVLYPKGHKKIDERYINIITQSYDVVLLDNGVYFSDIPDASLFKKIGVRPLFTKRIELLKTCLYAFNLYNIAKVAKHEKCQTVILLSVHIAAYALVHRFFKGINVVMVHHYDIDRMKANPKEISSFNKYKNKVRHVVLEDFIKEGVVSEYAVDPEKVFTVNLPIVIDNSPQSVEEQNNTFIALGQATDEELIDRFVEIDENSAISDSNVKIILRSKKREYQGKNVQVITGFFERAEYDRLYAEAAACIVCYPSTYKLRSSGSIDDAFSKRKKVIVIGFPAGRAYANAYPKNCIVCEDANTLVDMIGSFDKLFDENDFKYFCEIHSNENIALQWQDAIDLK